MIFMLFCNPLSSVIFVTGPLLNYSLSLYFILVRKARKILVRKARKAFFAWLNKKSPCKITSPPNYATKLWAYQIPTPANLLIYKESGYNLKVRGSNPLPATISLKSKG